MIAVEGREISFGGIGTVGVIADWWNGIGNRLGMVILEPKRRGMVIAAAKKYTSISIPNIELVHNIPS